jgi:hypothetical protein
MLAGRALGTRVSTSCARLGEAGCCERRLVLTRSLVQARGRRLKAEPDPFSFYPRARAENPLFASEGRAEDPFRFTRGQGQRTRFSRPKAGLRALFVSPEGKGRVPAFRARRQG